MNCIKSVCNNFESMSDNVKKDLQFDKSKNKVNLEATVSYIKNSERFSGSLF